MAPGDIGTSQTMRASPRITPMMRQYLDAKAEYPDALLLFRMGDFYELFFEDAATAAAGLELTLTSRDKDKGDDAIPMAGFPHHAAGSYISRLIELGHKVAICDQMEDPKQAKGLVKRAITRVVTSGTALEDEVLDARRNNYLAALIGLPGEPGAAAAGDVDAVSYGLAAIDVSTGECSALQTADLAEVIEAIDRLGVTELLHAADLDPAAVKRVVQLDQRRRVAALDPTLLVRLDEKFFTRRWPDGVDPAGPAAVATRAAMAYVVDVQRGRADQLGQVVILDVAEHLLLDAATRRHLDLLQNSVDGKRRGSLLGAIDSSVTAMGGRRVARWLSSPARRSDLINARLDAVAALVAAPVTRARLRDLLKPLPDLERLSGRASAGRASPRDLGAIGRALAALPGLRAIASESRMAAWAERIDPLPVLADLLGRALVDDPPLASRDGGIIRQGFDPDVDRLATISGGAKETLAAIELRERERTGIGSLKVRYNKVFGYFIEVTRTHLSKVPADYIRKQTVATGERYITEELKQLEDEILTANDRRIARELALFEQLCEQVNAAGPQLRAVAAAIGELDALGGLAETAARYNYVRPQFHDDDDLALAIDEGRHPVVEQFSRELGESFVPNSVKLDCRERQILIVTGPNMAGKSTVMRQVALIQILAQAGSFVPAQSARLPICDRVFTRVGASDDVSRGRSTFMVEMIETARILSGATRDSLVLLDEIGRGTSTFDGLAIAWAVAEHLHDAIGCKTLFATHYHELTDLTRVLARVKNVHVAVKEWNDQVLFLRRLLDGAAERSYGIQVARLANLPESVLDRAKEVLVNLERAELDSENMPTFSQSKKQRGKIKQLGLFDPPAPVDALRARLTKIDPDVTAPLEALALLAELKKLAQDK